LNTPCSSFLVPVIQSFYLRSFILKRNQYSD